MRVQQSTGCFALCLEDGGLDDLEARKLYQVLPDREAAASESAAFDAGSTALRSLPQNNRYPCPDPSHNSH